MLYLKILQLVKFKDMNIKNFILPLILVTFALTACSNHADEKAQKEKESKDRLINGSAKQ